LFYPKIFSKIGSISSQVQKIGGIDAIVQAMHLLKQNEQGQVAGLSLFGNPGYIQICMFCRNS